MSIRARLDGAWRSPFAIFVGTKIGGGSAMPAGEVRRFQALTRFDTGKLNCQEKRINTIWHKKNNRKLFFR